MIKYISTIPVSDILNNTGYSDSYHSRAVLNMFNGAVSITRTDK